MILSVSQSMALLVIALLAVVILLRILMVVHRQNGKVSELEMRMKAMEKMEAEAPKDPEETEKKG